MNQARRRERVGRCAGRAKRRRERCRRRQAEGETLAIWLLLEEVEGRTDRNDKVKGIGFGVAKLVGPVLQPRCVGRVLGKETSNIEAFVVFESFLNVAKVVQHTLR